MTHNNPHINGHDCDIFFKINGVFYGLHKNKIIKSLFFKALLDNEQYMGIKNDEIMICDYCDTIIDSDYVYDVLNWLYGNGTHTMEGCGKLSNPATINDLVTMLQYYILSNFFQMDTLRKIFSGKLLDIIKTLCGTIPQKINITNDRYANPKYIMINYADYEYSMEKNDAVLWNNNGYRNDFRRFLKVLSENFSYIKKRSPKYFARCINEYRNKHESQINVIKYISNYILHNDEIKFVYDRSANVLELTNVFSCNIDRCTIIKILVDLHGYVFTNDIAKSLYWFSSRENSIPQELAAILMDMFPDSDYPIRLMDTEDWQADGTLNWPAISSSENMCINYGNSTYFKNKMDAYMKLEC